MVEGIYAPTLEMLTFTGSSVDSQSDRWLQRTLSNSGERLGSLRDRIIANARIQRHHLVLDLHAASGLLTWEALRKASEGTVYTLARSTQDAEALQQMASNLSELRRPLILVGELSQASQLLADKAPGILLDVVIGRNALIHEPDKRAIGQQLAELLRPGAHLVLAETAPRHTQRLYRLINTRPLGSALSERLITAEEAIYQDASDPMTNWDADDLEQAFVAARLEVALQVETETTEVRVTESMLDRWFTPRLDGRPSYSQRVGEQMTVEELSQIESSFRGQLTNQVISWESKIIHLVAKKPL